MADWNVFHQVKDCCRFYGWSHRHHLENGTALIFQPYATCPYLTAPKIQGFKKDAKNPGFTPLPSDPPPRSSPLTHTEEDAFLC